MTRRDSDEAAKKQMEILAIAWERDMASVRNTRQEQQDRDSQLLSRRTLLGAVPGLAGLPALIAERAPDERLREALQRVKRLEAALKGGDAHAPTSQRIDAAPPVR